MSRRFKVFLKSTLAIMIIAPVIWYSLKFHGQYKTRLLHVKAQEKYVEKYAYTLLGGNLDQTMYADDKKKGRKLVRYYNQLSEYQEKLDSGEIEPETRISFISGDTLYNIPITIPVPIKYLSVHRKVFMEEDSEIDSLVKVFVFNTECWGYFEAYVPVSNLHDDPPEDQLYQVFIENISTLPSKADNVYGSPSPYGFYCN